MAIKPCKECGKEVSTKAKTCPNCGVKNPGVTAKDMFFGMIGISAIAVGVVYFLSSSDSEESSQKTQPTVEQAAEELAACKNDLKCWAEKHSALASVYCANSVENLAQYSSKWTDGMFEVKFSHFKWSNKGLGHVTYIGDKIQFQNGFGAMQNHIYECDYDPETEAVLAVRAQPGSLK